MDEPSPLARFVRAVPRHGKRLQFMFEGEAMSGFEGETVLTALLCNTGHVRQFEFSAALRAGFCVMAVCQDCWVWREDGTRLRSCTTPLADGMRLLSAPPPPKQV
jgi:predicted molibdopterin-dependent oxidoreductase YjgC